MEEIVAALLAQNVKLTEQIIELSKVIAQLNEPVPAPVYTVPDRQYPLHVPESEEDARAAFEAGEITREQLQEVLNEVEFYNTDITIPTSL